MDSREISLKIFESIDKALDLEYNRLYINVDDLCNGNGFLRVLAMKGPKDIIVYEGTFKLDVCYQVLELIKKSEYKIKDVTTKLIDD